MAFSELPPPPPPPHVQWFDEDGRPTKAVVEWLQKLMEYLKRMGAAIP